MFFLKESILYTFNPLLHQSLIINFILLILFPLPFTNRVYSFLLNQFLSFYYLISLLLQDFHVIPLKVN